MAIRVGVIHDYPSADGGDIFHRAMRMGMDEVLAGDRLGDDVEIVTAIAPGTPRASTESVCAAYSELVAGDVLAVVGPAISDSACAVLPIVERSRVPTINYTGSERARSEFMFHLQVGSLEEEPYVIAQHLASRRLTRVGLVRETSFIGEQCAAFFAEACHRHDLALQASVTIAPDGGGAGDAVKTLGDLRLDAVVYLGLGLSAHALGEAMASSDLPVAANSALMFGYALPEWTEQWEGWTYVDVLDDSNRELDGLRRRWQGDFSPGPAIPVPYDLGRLLAHGLIRAPRLDRDGVKEGLERVKHVPACLGADGTRMGFGHWERSALKGEYLVVRTWRQGRSVSWPPQP